MTNEVINIDQMTETIVNHLKNYTEDAKKKINEVCKEESDSLKERLKKDSPKSNRKGRKPYASTWKVRKAVKADFVQYEVYNTQGQLTHLLEKGHQNFVGTTKGNQKQVHTKGGRTRAFPHIKPNEETAKKNVENRIKEVLIVIISFLKDLKDFKNLSP